LTERTNIKGIAQASLELTFANKKFLFATLILQILYWFVYIPAFETVPIPRDMYVREVQVTALETPTPQALRKADWQSVKLTWTGCCDKKYYALKYTFSLNGKWQDDLGLIPNIGADNYYVYINGQVLRDYGRLQPVPSFHAMKKDLIRIPRIA